MSTPISPGSDNRALATQDKDKGTEQSAKTAPTDLPLATSLPSWDLVPLHTLLVRRKPVSQ
jgi:hypothetical protein